REPSATSAGVFHETSWILAYQNAASSGLAEYAATSFRPRRIMISVVTSTAILSSPPGPRRGEPAARVCPPHSRALAWEGPQSGGLDSQLRPRLRLPRAGRRPATPSGWRGGTS